MRKLWFICLPLAGIMYAWNQLQIFRPTEHILPTWTANSGYMPLDSVHVSAALAFIIVATPMIALFMDWVDGLSYQKWWSKLLFLIGTWLAFWQPFIYVYHAIGRKIPDWQYIWDSYRIWEYFK